MTEPGRLEGEHQTAVTALALRALARPHGAAICGEALDLLGRLLGMELGEVLGVGRGVATVPRTVLGIDPSESPPGDRSEIGYLAERAGAVSVPDLRAGPFEPSPWSARLEVRSFAGVRLDDHEQPAGVLALYSRSPRNPSESELRLLEAVAGVLVAVFQRGRWEAEVRQNQTLEAIGQLAAGVAHEINTPIQFVGDNVQFLSDAFQGLRGLLGTYAGWLASGTLDPAARRAADAAADLAYLDDEVPKALAQTIDGVERVATIVRALKDFAHPDAAERTPTDLNRAIESTLTVAHNQVKYVADVTTDLGEIPPVVCHVGEIRQVILNLVINAADAIQDSRANASRPGRILVRTRHEADWVIVTVEDDGGGIPPEVQSRVFEPFFTTKEVGRGTGQGLALAHSVIAAHQGSIGFECREGEGTTFAIRLPVKVPEVPS